MSAFFIISAVIFGLSIVSLPVLLIWLIVTKVMGKETTKAKKNLQVSGFLLVVSIVASAITAPPTNTNANDTETNQPEKETINQDSGEKEKNQDEMDTETDAMCEHSWVEISRKEPTYENNGESVLQCEFCQQEIQTTIPKLEEIVTFEEIYTEYKANELRADELYKNNRYVVTGEVNGMNTGGLLNWSGGATLTMETRVGNTRVFYYAEFEKEQEEALKEINVGDTITFEGECLSAGSWDDCILIVD